MPVIRRTAQAEEDLIDIWLYIAQDNPGAADRLLDEIEDKLRLACASDTENGCVITNQIRQVALNLHVRFRNIAKVNFHAEKVCIEKIANMLISQSLSLHFLACCRPIGANIKEYVLLSIQSSITVRHLNLRYNIEPVPCFKIDSVHFVKN